MECVFHSMYYTVASYLFALRSNVLFPGGTQRSIDLEGNALFHQIGNSAV